MLFNFLLSLLLFRSFLLPCKFIHLMSWLSMSFYLLPSSLDERTEGKKNFFFHQHFQVLPFDVRNQISHFFGQLTVGSELFFLCFCKSKLIAQMLFTINNEKRIFFVCMLFLCSLPSLSALLCFVRF